MKILIADDEDVARNALALVMRQKGYEVAVVCTGTDALRIATESNAPRILLLDWMMPELEGVEVCRRLRSRTGAPYTYIIIVSGRSRQRDILEAMEAGADDFISKPYDLHELLARVRVGERVLETSSFASKRLHDAMKEALSSPGGEVIARQGDAVGRIHVTAGRIAWAHLSTEPGSLRDILKGEVPITSEEAGCVIEEARASRRSFGDVLMQWNLVEPERLRACLRGWIARKLRLIMSMEQASVVFVPQTRPPSAASSNDLTFAVDEVYPLEADEGAGPSTQPSPTTRPPAASESAGASGVTIDPGRFEPALAEAMAVDGALWAVVFDVRTGLALRQQGRPVDMDLALAQLKAISVAQLSDDSDPEDMLLVTNKLVHIMRPAKARSVLVLYLVLRRTGSVLAMARMGVASAVARLPSSITGASAVEVRSSASSDC